MAEKKHVIEYTDIIKAFEKVKEKLKNKSDKGHQHGNADITDIDASKIKSGTIDIDRLPKGAIERMVYVKDDAARFALTTNTTQNGDTVKVRSTKKMFYVIDDTKLSSEAGYEAYTAESASTVPWSGVTGKPTTFTPEAHTHAISDVADLQETLTGLRQDVNAKPSKDTNTTYSLIQDSTDGHKLTFKGSDGSTKTVTIPDNDHNDNTWRDVVDSLDSARTDASLSANQGRVLNGKFGGYLPLHGTADIAASVTDYGDTAKHIQIGFSGAGITGDDIKYIAGYTGGDGGNLSAKIKDISKDALKSWLGLGSRAYDSTSYLPLSGGTVTGAIHANGGVIGDLTGNAKTATTANSANSANELKSITLTGTDDNTTGFRLIASINVGAHWSNYRANFIVRSRHQGNGLLCIAAGCNSNVHNKENTYVQIRYYGNTSSGAIIQSNGYLAYLSPDCKTVYLFWLYEDYSEARLTPVYGSDFEVSNGAWMTSIDESTYGTCIALTEINHADSGTSATLGRSGDASIPMTFNWSGKDGQPTWLWGGTDGSNMYVYNPSNFAVDNAGSIRDSSGNGNLLSASYSKNGLDYSEYTWLAAWNGTELRAVTKGQFATAGHTHGLTHSDLIAAIDATSGGWDLIGGNNGFILKSIRTNASAPKWTIDNFSAAIAFGGADTKGIITIPYSYAGVKFAGGNGDSPRWYFDIFGTNEKSYNLDSFLTSHQDISGKLDKSDIYAWAKAPSKPSYSWSEISGRPTALSSFTNDRGYITGITKAMVTGALGYTPPTTDTNTTYSASTGLNLSGTSFSVKYGSTAGTACQGNDSRLSNSRPASDVYSWAKASSKPSYTWTEISNKPDIPSISHDTPTRTNWTIDSKYNCIVYRIGDFCLAVVAVTGTIYPRQWLPAAQLSKDVTPKTQSSIIISSVSGSDHMECMVTTDGYIKMWWSGSSPATSANICIPYYIK